MGFRFWRRVKILPGVTLNFSKSGVSLSLGPRGAKFTMGRRGTRATVGIPGTGLFYTTKLAGGGASGGRGRRRLRATVPPAERLSLGFFKRLITPAGEEALVDGCRALVLGDQNRALGHARKAVHLADGAYLAGVLALKQEHLTEAAKWLGEAAEMHSQLGRCFSRYGISPTVTLPITDEVSAEVAPSLRGVLLALTEVYQRQARLDKAMACVERLRRLEPEDPVVKLSLIELLLERAGGRREVCRRVVRLAEGVENESPVHTAILLYKARALRKLGLLSAARELLTGALRRKKDRSADLLKALRYERVLVYEALGEARRCRKELERIYAEDPDWEDVSKRLGVAT